MRGDDHLQTEGSLPRLRAWVTEDEFAFWRWSRRGALAAGTLSLFLAIQDGHPAAFLILGLSFSLAWLARWMLGHITATPFCVLCSRTRAPSLKLCTGVHGAVCDACVPTLIEMLLTNGVAPTGVVLAVLGALPPTTPHAVTAALADTLLTLVSGAPALRTLADTLAERYDDAAAARRVLERIPAGDRTAGDRAALATLLDRTGDAVGAFALLDEVLTTPDWSPFSRALLRSNRVCVALGQASPDVGSLRAEIDQVLAIADGSSSGEPAFDARERARVRGVRAMVLLAQGEHKRALEDLDAADALLTGEALITSSAQRLTRARVNLAFGDVAAARVALEQTLAAAHPESPEHREAQATLGELAGR